MNNFDKAPDIWQKQTTEGLVLSPDEIRQRVVRSKLRVQRRRTICGVIAAIMLLTAIAIVLYPDTSAVIWLRAIQVLTWVVLLGIGPRLYEERRQLLSLGLASSPVPCLVFYQRELERYRDSLRPIPWLMTIVSVSGLALATFAPRNRSTLIPLGLLMVLIAAGLYLRMRSQGPKIQTELEDLRRIRSESQ